MLPYDAVRTAEKPDEVLLEFAQSTYDAASTLGKWDRAALQEVKPYLHSPGSTRKFTHDESWLRSGTGCMARSSKDGWRPLYGDVDRIGVAIEWHDFRIERSFNWGRTFHPNSLEFCLNLNGHGAVGGAGGTRSDYVPGNCGYYAVADEPLPASRRAHDHHQFVTLEFSREHLQKQLAQNEADLEPEIAPQSFRKERGERGRAARPMTAAATQRRGEPDGAAGRQSGAEFSGTKARRLELMAQFFFAPKDPEFFCMRQKRVARERVDAGEGIARARSGEPADAGNVGAGGGLQPVLLEQNFFARSRSHNSAILAKCSHGTRGRVVAHRPLQRHRSRDRSRLFEPESFQQSILRNHRLLPGAVPDGEERPPRSLTRLRES